MQRVLKRGETDRVSVGRRVARPARRPGSAPSRAGRFRRVFPLAFLAAAIVVVLVIAIGQLGASSSSARTEEETVTAESGVVQSTVTGTGNLEPVTDEDVNFQTSGTLTHVYVKSGEKVKKGQLLATVDPTSAKLTLSEARATLASSKTALTKAEDSDSSSTSASTEVTHDTDFVSYSPKKSTSAGTETKTVTVTAPATTSSSTTTSSAQTTPTNSAASTTTTSASATTPAQTTTTSSANSPGSSGTSTTGSSSQGTSTTTTTSSAGTIAADKLAVYTDEQAVQTDKTALAETRLRAPVSGTITSLEDLTAGDSVSSATDSTAASSSDTSSSDSTDSGSGSLGGTTSTSTSASTSSSSSSEFAEITSLHRLSMTVAFDESDISKVKVGQAATVTLDALTGVELAAKVTAVSSLGTESSSVVSYDATLTLQQHDARVKPGMSASAAVIVSQGQGVTVPNDAVTGTGTLGTVTEQVGGKSVSKQVIVGLRGDSRTLIVSGLKAGTQLIVKTTLPSASSSAATTTSSSGASGTLGSSSGSSAAGTGGLPSAGGGAGGGTGGPP
jgi:multidrug efflux pump subunit AcrA (membrane-fusion protein)